MGRRRRSAAWRAEYEAAATKAAWLDEQQVSGMIGAPSAQAMDEAWVGVSSAINDIDQQLFGLRDTAPDEAARQRLDLFRGAVDHLRGALLTLVEYARSGASADVQRQQTALVEQARVELRQAITPDGTT